MSSPVLSAKLNNGIPFTPKITKFCVVPKKKTSYKVFSWMIKFWKYLRTELLVICLPPFHSFYIVGNPGVTHINSLFHHEGGRLDSKPVVCDNEFLKPGSFIHLIQRKYVTILWWPIIYRVSLLRSWLSMNTLFKIFTGVLRTISILLFLILTCIDRIFFYLLTFLYRE
jgi:hypothetical protein